MHTTDLSMLHLLPTPLLSQLKLLMKRTRLLLYTHMPSPLLSVTPALVSMDLASTVLATMVLATTVLASTDSATMDFPLSQQQLLRRARSK